jgi:hypothetical protein
MNAEELLTERIRHEIDMDILRKLGEEAGVDLSEEIINAEKKFENKVDRVLNGMTNESIHKINDTEINS